MYTGADETDNYFKREANREKVKISDLEKDKLISSIKGLQPEQQEIVIQTFPDEILWSELKRRYDETIALGHKMRELIN